MLEHTVIELRNNDALLFTKLELPYPYIVAHGYNQQRRDWSYGSYYNTLLDAVLDLHDLEGAGSKNSIMVTPVLIQWRDTGERERVYICESECELPSEADDKIFFYGMNREDLLEAWGSGRYVENEWKVCWVGKHRPLFY